ncbi:MAG TPA: hypothetical protein VND88_09640 [Candidatus Acidoferrales bacterium]|nr:hypothetical protein [Candidatus Acidoferrales bacterium]
MRFGEQDRHSYAIEQTPPRNVAADIAEWAARTAPPPPASHFAAPPAARQLSGTEYVAAQLAERRRAKEAEQVHGTILDAAVERLGVLLEAVADQREGRELTSRQMAALGDLSRLLFTARERRVGLGPAGVYAVAPAEPAPAPVVPAAPVAVAPPRMRTRTR